MVASVAHVCRDGEVVFILLAIDENVQGTGRGHQIHCVRSRNPSVVTTRNDIAAFEGEHQQGDCKHDYSYERPESVDFAVLEGEREVRKHRSFTVGRRVDFKG